MKRAVIAGYVLCAIASWFLVSGWVYADMSAAGRPGQLRTNSGEAVLVAVFFAATWPIGVPAAYCFSGYAEHGWKPIWRLE